jgi:hypothetical protein
VQSGMLLATMLASAPKPTAAEGRPIAQGENGESFDSLLSLFLGDRPLVAHDGEGSPMEASAPDMEGEQGPLLEGPEYTLPEETRQEELGPNPEQEVHPREGERPGRKDNRPQPLPWETASLGGHAHDIHVQGAAAAATPRNAPISDAEPEMPAGKRDALVHAFRQPVSHNYLAQHFGPLRQREAPDGTLPGFMIVPRDETAKPIAAPEGPVGDMRQTLGKAPVELPEPLGQAEVKLPTALPVEEVGPLKGVPTKGEVHRFPVRGIPRELRTQPEQALPPLVEPGLQEELALTVESISTRKSEPRGFQRLYDAGEGAVEHGEGAELVALAEPAFAEVLEPETEQGEPLELSPAQHEPEERPVVTAKESTPQRRTVSEQPVDEGRPAGEAPHAAAPPNQEAQRLETLKPTAKVQPSASEPLDLTKAADTGMEIAERMQASLSRERSEIRIQLKPEHLGELKIKVAVEHGVVSAEFVAETAAVKSIIEAHLPELRSALQDLGTNVAELAVHVGTQERPGQDRQPSERQHWRGPRKSARTPVDSSTAVTAYGRDGWSQIDLKA